MRGDVVLVQFRIIDTATDDIDLGQLVEPYGCEADMDMRAAASRTAPHVARTWSQRVARGDH